MEKRVLKRRDALDMARACANDIGRYQPGVEIDPMTGEHRGKKALKSLGTLTDLIRSHELKGRGSEDVIHMVAELVQGLRVVSPIWNDKVTEFERVVESRHLENKIEIPRQDRRNPTFRT